MIHQQPLTAKARARADTKTSFRDAEITAKKPPRKIRYGIWANPRGFICAEYANDWSIQDFFPT